MPASQPPDRQRRRAPASTGPKVWPVGCGAPPPPGRFVAVVPGEAAPLIPLALPPGLKGPARASVARRQALDRLGPAAGRLELRPAPLGTGPDGWSALLAADPADLSRWRAGLAAAGGRPVALLPDYLALPAAPGVWVLAVDAAAGGPTRILARLGPADGFAAEAALAAAMLTQARGRGPTPRAVLVAGDAPLPHEVAGALAGLTLVQAPDRLPPGLQAPVALAAGETALDLRRDPAETARALAATLRALVVPALLALAGVLGWAAAIHRESAGLLARAAAVDAATLEVVRRDLLPEGPILDIRRQVEREIAARRAAALDGVEAKGALALIRAAAEGLAATGIPPTSLTLSPDGRLAADLVLPDFATLDRTVAALGGAGLAVEVLRSAGTGAGRVGAALVLHLAGAGPSGAAP